MSLASLSKIKPFFKNFFPKDVVAYITDSSIDFTLFDDSQPFNNTQREYLSSAFNFDTNVVFNVRQVHGSTIIRLKKNNSFPEKVFLADGIVTNCVDIPIAVRTADCLSIFIFDSVKRCIGIVHAGWKGTKQQIAFKAVKALEEEWGCAPAHLKVAFGPAIQKCCYEVGVEFKRYFPEALIHRHGRLFLDLPLVNKKQLIKAGVKEENILDHSLCTSCRKEYFSFRRDGEKCGRMLHLMMLKS